VEIMDMRSALQLLKNLAANVTFKFDGHGILPSVEITGKGLLELHADSIWVAQVVGSSFSRSMIFWEPIEREFRLVDPPYVGLVCQQALQKAALALGEGVKNKTGNSAAQFAIVDLLVAAQSIIEVAAKNVIVDLDAYNKRVSEPGGNSSKPMTQEEHFRSVIWVVREVREQTYPLWSSLVALLPEGEVKSRAEEHLRVGCRDVRLDSGDIAPDWQVFPLEERSSAS
jgi:hypothetical protein